jgi:hypothetical protein
VVREAGSQAPVDPRRFRSRHEHRLWDEDAKS